MKSSRDFLRKKLVPLNATIELTFRCNLQCVHCYQKHYIRKEELNIKDIEILLCDFKNLGTFTITFTGGEPLLYPSFLDLLRLDILKDFRVSIITNGTLWTPEHIKAIKEIPHSEIQITLFSLNMDTHDLITKISGSFNKTLNTIELFKRNYMKFSIFSPVLKQNVTDIKDLENYCKKNNIPFSKSSIIYPISSNESNCCQLSNDSLKEYIENYKGNEYLRRSITSNFYFFCCSAAKNSFLISPEGIVYPCNLIRINCGNIRELYFKEIWEKSSLLNQIRNLERNDSEICSICANFFICKRCPGLFLLLTDNMLNPPLTFCNSVN